MVRAGGLRLLFAVLDALGAAVTVWAAIAVPVIAPLPKARQTVLDLVRWLVDPVFLGPTSALAAATAALSVGVGFLPVSGPVAGLGTVATGAAVSVLAACAAVVRPPAGRALDAGGLTTRSGSAAGLSVTAAGLACAMLPGLTGILLGAALIGVGTGLITPLGCAALASSSSSPPTNAWARPWARPNSAASSATRAGPSSLPPSLPWPPSPTASASSRL